MNVRTHAEVAEERISSTIEAALHKSANDRDGNSAFRLIEYFRKEVQFEMNLIGLRITWLLAVQAFLVTASVLSLAESLNNTETFGGWLAVLSCGICVVGGIISFKTIDAVDRVKCTIDLWHRRTKMMFGIGESLSDKPEWLAMVLGRWVEGDDPFHQESMRLSNVIMPWVFITFWVVLFIGEELWRLGF